MSRVEKLSIAVSPEMAAMLRGAVADGRYASASELVREALRDWTDREALRAEAIAELQKLWDDGLASGPARPAGEVFARIRTKIEATSAR